MGHAGHAGAADSAAAAAGQQQQQQLALAAGLGGVGASPRNVATAAVQLQLPLRHAVSRELQVYFDRVVGLILAPVPVGSAVSGFTPAKPPPAAAAAAAAAPAAGGSGGPPAGSNSGTPAGPTVDKQAAMLQGALSSVASDPGLHSLVPYLCAFIADGVKQHLGSLVVVHRLLLLTRALLVNPGVHLAPYLQQLLPAVVTCVVTKALGERSWLHALHVCVSRVLAGLLYCLNIYHMHGVHGLQLGHADRIHVGPGSCVILHRHLTQWAKCTPRTLHLCLPHSTQAPPPAKHCHHYTFPSTLTTQHMTPW
jgi:hypothetical protein